MNEQISESLASLRRLISALQQPSCFDHAVSRFETIETHISIVLLTGEYAYKFKKPVDLGFVDFTSLDKRRHFCDEELRLNRRLAPDLYVDVLSVGGEPDTPSLNTIPAIEYCVRMRQFPRSAELDRVLAEQGVSAEAFRRLAFTVADFHDRSEPALAGSDYGSSGLVRRYCLANFDALDPGLLASDCSVDLESLYDWCRAEIDRVGDLIDTRHNGGRVRECHGDMHLTNMIWLDNCIQVFDCIEFNAELRWIDVMNEIAFLLMDLDSRGRTDLGRVFLNAYLEAGGDYAGLPLLRFFKVYRSMVRAKVATLRVGQAEEEDREKARRAFTSHVRQADNYIHRQTRAILIITCGLSGSGKTTLTEELIPEAGIIRVRSDIQRKRLAGLKAEAHSHSGFGRGLYDTAHTEQTYEHLADCARSIINAGLPAIVDATFLKAAQRRRFQDLAQELDVPFRVLDCQAPEDVLRERIVKRGQQGRDASEADLAVLEHQLAAVDSLTDQERALAVRIDTTQPLEHRQLIEALGL